MRHLDLARRLALIAVLLIFGSKLVYWGLGRVGSSEGSGDFKTLYAASRAWSAHENPYDYATLDRVLLDARAGPTKADFWTNTPSLYPPTAFVAMWPATRLPWGEARAAWAGINLVFIGLLIWTLVRWTGLALTSWQGLFLAALVLGLRPVHTGLALGQPAIGTVSLLVVALYLAHRFDRQVVAGALIGIACCVKPQLAGPFVVAAAVTGWWRTVASAAAVYAAAWAISVGWAAAHGVPLLGAWRSLLLHSVGPGSINDPSPANEARYQLVNLQVPLAALFASPAIFNGLAMAVSGAMGVASLVALRRLGPANHGLLLSTATIGAIALLPVYHRIYDGLVLVLAIAWAVRTLADRRDRLAAWGVIACAIAFIAPMQVALVVAQKLAPSVVGRPWWDAIGVAHMAVATAIAAAVLLARQLSAARASAPRL